MKRRIRFQDNIHKKETITEIEIPAKDHLAAQQKFRANVFKAKKGKGSFTRKLKHKNKQEEE